MDACTPGRGRIDQVTRAISSARLVRTDKSSALEVIYMALWVMEYTDSRVGGKLSQYDLGDSTFGNY